MEQKWVDFIRETLRVLKEESHMIFPLRGVAWKIDKKQKLATLVVCAKPAQKSNSRIITEKILRGLGYEVNESPTAIKNTPEEYAESLRELETGDTFISPDLIDRLGKLWQAWLERN